MIGLRSASHHSEADVVTVKMEGVDSFSFDVDTIAGRKQFEFAMIGLAAAHKLGRRSVGVQIRDIFESSPVR